MDDHDQEALSFAYLYIPSLGIGVVSDQKGFYFFENLCAGTYTVVCTHVGCEDISAKIKLTKDEKLDFFPEHHSDLLGEVSIKGKNKHLAEIHGGAYLAQKDLDQSAGSNIADQLKSINGVRTLNTGTTISKPVIHGLHSNRVLVLNNGIRQEGQQWGSEHAPEIDPMLAQEIVVVKGASGLKFGPEALGGVVMVNPAPIIDSFGINARLNFQGLSNGRQGTIGGMIEGRAKKIPSIGWRLQGSLKKGGNLRTPDYFLKNTGIAEYNFSYAIEHRGTRFNTSIFYSQFNSDIGIFAGSHIGNLSDLLRAFEANEPLDTADFSYKIGFPKQHIEHELFKMKSNLVLNNNHQIHLTYARQFNKRMEYDVHQKKGEEGNPAMQLELTTHSLESQWEHRLAKNLNGELGLASMYQSNTYDGRFFIPNFEKKGIGSFWIEKWLLDSSNIEIEAGLRFDLIEQLIYQWDKNEIIRSKFVYQNASANVGIFVPLSRNWFISSNASKAWRPPSVNEMFANGLHHGAASIEIGDINLKMEELLNFNLNFEYRSEKTLLQVEGYVNSFANFIYLTPTGIPSLTIRGAFPTFSFSQIPSNQKGLDLTWKQRINRQFSYTGKYSTLVAINSKNGEYLEMMPADKHEHVVEYKLSGLKKGKVALIGVSLEHVFEQKRIEPGRDFVKPPEAYTLLHAHASMRVEMNNQIASFNVVVSNVLNTSYRDYMNRFRYYSDDLGTNVSIKCSLPLSLLNKHN
jgi:iron complex outermembrane receptor protein